MEASTPQAGTAVAIRCGIVRADKRSLILDKHDLVAPPWPFRGIVARGIVRGTVASVGMSELFGRRLRGLAEIERASTGLRLNGDQ